MMALDTTYGQRLLQPFHSSLPGITLAALRFAPMVAPQIYLAALGTDPWVRGIDQLPRLVGGMIGLVTGLWVIGKSAGWDDRLRSRRVAAVGVIGLVAVGGYMFAWNTRGYYNTLVHVHSLYTTERYQKAADLLKTIPPQLTDNKHQIWGIANKALVVTDIADLYYDAGDSRSALEYYKKLLAMAPGPGSPVRR